MELLDTTKSVQCIRCKTYKDSSKFSLNAAAKTGLQAYCKKCNREYQRSRSAVKIVPAVKASGLETIDIFGTKVFCTKDAATILFPFSDAQSAGSLRYTFSKWVKDNHDIEPCLKLGTGNYWKADDILALKELLEEAEKERETAENAALKQALAVPATTKETRQSCGYTLVDILNELTVLTDKVEAMVCERK